MSLGYSMAILQVRDLDDRLYSVLRDKARNENRSISQEVVTILEAFLANPASFAKNPTREFLSLGSAWDDARRPDEIVMAIRKQCKSSRRFRSPSVLPD